MRNALTVDLEDYYHSGALAVPREDWDRLPSHVARNVNRLRALLDRHETRATCFVVGWLADRFPRVIEALARDGHEIACHGYWHADVRSQTPEQLAAELRLTIEAVGAATGTFPSGFRAPHYAISDIRHWAFEVLVENGLAYDSSLMAGRACGPRGSRTPEDFFVLPRGLVEFPVLSRRLPGVDSSDRTGSSLRLRALRGTTRAISRLNERGVPATVAVRLWELDPEQPRLPCGVWTRLWRYRGLEEAERKLGELLQAHRFDRLSGLADARAVERERTVEEGIAV